MLSDLPLPSFAVAETVVVPSAFALIVPAALTEAVLLFPVFHVTVFSSANPGLTVTFSLAVLPFSTEIFFSCMETFSTGILISLF